MAKKSFKIDPAESILTPVQRTETPSEDVKPVKGKVGRPRIKQGEYKTVNIAVPLDLYNQMQGAARCNSMSMTQYVNKVIEDDLKANGERYEQIKKLMGGN